LILCLFPLLGLVLKIIDASINLISSIFPGLNKNEFIIEDFLKNVRVWPISGSKGSKHYEQDLRDACRSKQFKLFKILVDRKLNNKTDLKEKESRSTNDETDEEEKLMKFTMLTVCEFGNLSMLKYLHEKKKIGFEYDDSEEIDQEKYRTGRKNIIVKGNTFKYRKIEKHPRRVYLLLLRSRLVCSFELAAKTFCLSLYQIVEATRLT